jgi:hypothetical protein
LGTKRSKVTPAYKTKYKVNNWPEYDRALVARGDVTQSRKPWGASPTLSSVQKGSLGGFGSDCS